LLAGGNLAAEQHRGFGFVEFENREDAAAAVDNMNNGELYGRVLKERALSRRLPKPANQGTAAAQSGRGWIRIFTAWAFDPPPGVNVAKPQGNKDKMKAGACRFVFGANDYGVSLLCTHNITSSVLLLHSLGTRRVF
jgi:hypothetical protein